MVTVPEALSVLDHLGAARGLYSGSAKVVLIGMEEANALSGPTSACSRRRVEPAAADTARWATR